MATKNKIAFGTDGFRGIIADDFTFENVEKITNAICKYINEFEKNKNIVLIGYDPRFMADKFALFSAEILEKGGFEVLLSDSVCPTPAIAYTAKNIKNCAGALMFTASHNPKEYLGIKFIPNYGGPATKQITDKIVEYLDEPLIHKQNGRVQKFNFKNDYFKHLEKLIDFDAIKKAKIKFIFDGLFSASVGWFDEILNKHEINFDIYNNCYDPNFGGFLPEPKPKFIKNIKRGYLTLANDGDADRYGVIDEEGNYVSPNVVMAMLLKYLKEKGAKGKLIKTVGVSRLLDICAQKLDIETITTPVGFKWLGEAMRNNPTILAGEDSGGLSTGFHISEKDGIFANLLILEMVASSGKTLVEMQKDINDFAGTKFYQDRVDIKLFDDTQQERLQNKFINLENIDEFKIIDRLKIDGVKYFLDDNLSWVLMRPSGTEPLLRFYIESDNLEKTAAIKKFVSITISL